MESHTLNILLVEDNLKYVRLLECLVQEEEGSRVNFHHVGTLEDALNTLDQKEFDLIILDLFLPDSRGAISVESISQKTQTPVLFLTAMDDPEIKRQALSRGAKGFLIKDQIVDHFFPTIYRILNLPSSS